MKRKLILPIIFLFFLSAGHVRAHCPLCTAGAAVAAGGAMYLGVSQAVIGIFIGAFAISTGLWFSRMIKKQFVPMQKLVIAMVSYVLTVIPMLPIMSDVHPIYLFLSGDYGSLLNRTYVFNLFLFGSIIGSIIVFAAPSISKRVTAKRGKMIPYQGIAITFSLLALSGVILQLVI